MRLLRESITLWLLKLYKNKFSKFSTIVHFIVEKMIRDNNSRRHLLFNLAHWIMQMRPYFELQNSLLLPASAFCSPYMCVFDIVEKLLPNVFNNDAVLCNLCQTFQTIFKWYISHSCIYPIVLSYSAWKMLQ